MGLLMCHLGVDRWSEQKAITAGDEIIFETSQKIHHRLIKRPKISAGRGGVGGSGSVLTAVHLCRVTMDRCRICGIKSVGHNTWTFIRNRANNVFSLIRCFRV